MHPEGNERQTNQDPSRPSKAYSNGGSSGSAPSTPTKAPSSGFTNGSSSAKAESNGFSNGQTVARPTGAFFGHDREEVARILIQSLTDLGYHGAAGTLSRESGFELENPSVAAFRNAVQYGEWAEAEALLFGSSTDEDSGGVGLKANGNTQDLVEWLEQDSAAAASRGTRPAGLPLSEGANQHEMLFLIRQQKYLEHLEDRDIGSALMVLRQELTPLRQDTARLHALTSLMMCPSADDLKDKAHWDGADGESRMHLLSQLSKSIAPSVMIPEHRLAVLLDQVQEQQTNQCLYHNTTVAPSLYHNHVCERDDFPLQPLIELHDHHDEVWYIAFSNDGSKLATASSDNSIIIYETSQWKQLMRLSGTRNIEEVKGVCYVTWSPNDQFLLSCSRGNDLTVYDVKDGGRHVVSVQHFSYTVTSAAWTPDGQSFVVGTHDVDHALELYRLGQTKASYTWPNDDKTIRINDCSISADGSRLAVITMDQRVLTYDLKSRQRLTSWTMDDALTCVNLSKDGKHVLVSMNNSRLVTLDVVTGEMVQQYTGLQQNKFVIRSCFGGAGENFVISGSEDSHIYIWRRQSGIQVATLEAHAPGTVNCVSWHPTEPAMFASAGDDKKVKIWTNYALAQQRVSHFGRGLSLTDSGHRQ